MAAHKAGITTVLVPEENRADYERLDGFLKDSMEYIFCKNVDEVLDRALVIPKGKPSFEHIPDVIKDAKNAGHSASAK